LKVHAGQISLINITARDRFSRARVKITQSAEGLLDL
jgi:hypothetical protein